MVIIINAFRIFKYKQYPGYIIKRWYAFDRYGKHAQYSVYYYTELVGEQKPLISLNNAKSKIQQHKDLREFRLRYKKHLIGELNNDKSR